MTPAPVLAPWNREHGILFTAEMVRAIQRGKTETRRLSCRYQVGDLLYAKETWHPVPHADGIVVYYAADLEERHFWHGDIPPGWRFPKAAARGNVSPLFMPKWASRIWLEVTAVRKERLQDITEEGARAEGVRCSPVGLFDPIPVWHFGDLQTPNIYDSPIAAFEGLWDRIHGEGAWASNPEVYAIEFRRVK